MDALTGLFGLLAIAGSVFFTLWWFFAAVLISDYAKDKGRSAFGFFVMALLFSPLLAALLLIAAPDLKRISREREEAERRSKEYREAVNALWKQMDAIRLQLSAVAPATSVSATTAPAIASSLPSIPGVANGMGYCAGCGKLRHASVASCVYCKDTRPVVETPPQQASRSWQRADEIENMLDKNKRR